MFHIVDDMPELRDILSEIIASKGYKTMQFDSAESYLSYFNSIEYVAPIAILSDYIMDGQTGLQLIKKARSMPFRPDANLVWSMHVHSTLTWHSRNQTEQS